MPTNQPDHPSARSSNVEGQSLLDRMHALRCSISSARPVLGSEPSARPDSNTEFATKKQADLAHMRLIATGWAIRRTDDEAKKSLLRRHMIIVLHEATVVESYGSLREIRGGGRPAEGLYKIDSLDEVLEDLETRDLGHGVAGPRGAGERRDGPSPRDLTVWRDGRILAVVRPGADGRPIVTRFDR